MKRKLSGRLTNDDQVAIGLPTNKHLKLSNTTTKQVQLVLLDFHHVSSSLLMNHQQSQVDNPHLNHLYDLVKSKFENQSKGFAKWLLAREEWLAKSKAGEVKIEFINDHECVLKWAQCLDKYIHQEQLLVFPRVQFIDIEELYEDNQEHFHSVEFWKPFQEEVWYQLQKRRLGILKYLPVEVFTQFKEWKEKLAYIYQRDPGLDFVFDLDDIEKAKKAISEKRCEMFQISERLKDNEEFMKHAIQCNAKNIQFASKRLKNDRKFCLDVVLSTPYSLSYLNWVDKEEFALEILRIALPSFTIVGGIIQEKQIQACIPEACDCLSLSVWETNISMDDKMKIFQQYFLNDSSIDRYIDPIQSALQMLLELPDEYYQAHYNHQHTLSCQGVFAFSLSQQDLDNDPIVEQVLTRIYKDYDPPWKYDESSFEKREDIPLILKYGSMNLRMDRHFVLKAVELKEIGLKDIFPELRNDREIVLAFIRRNGRALYEKEESGNFVIPEEFRNDTEIILASLKSDDPHWFAFYEISQKCLENKELLLRILNDRHCFDDEIDFSDVLPRFVARKDKEVIAALNNSATYWKDLSDDFWIDRDFLLDAIRNKVHPEDVFYFASKELKQDTSFIMDFVKAHKKGLSSILGYKNREQNYDRHLFSEIAIEHVKSWGVISDEIFNVCFNQDPTSISFDEAMKFCKDLKNLRLEYEYFGCHIPESWMMKEKIKRFTGLKDKRYWKNKEEGYNFWKKIFGCIHFQEYQLKSPLQSLIFSLQIFTCHHINKTLSLLCELAHIFLARYYNSMLYTSLKAYYDICNACPCP